MLKYCAFFSLCAGVAFAQQFITGQAARLVIGQTTFTSQNFGASNTLLGGAAGIAFAGDTLFVADSNRVGYTPINNRVLLFEHMSQILPTPLGQIPAYSGTCPVCGGQATLVLGQPDFLGTSFSTTQTGMRTPVSVATDGINLAVADTENNRVLLWKSIPTTNDQPPDLVLGQPDFNTIGPVVATASSFRGPQGVWIQNGKLFVADTQNNRIMIWNSIPSKNNQAADVELGQSNFTSVGAIPPTTVISCPTCPGGVTTSPMLTATQGTMLNPVSVTSDGVHLFVADLGYNRVLIWNAIPTQNGKPADVEVGQLNFTNAIPNNDNVGMCPQAGLNTSVSPPTPTYPDRCGRTLNYPRFALSDGTRLFIADGGNDRVLIFNHIPTQNGPEADVVLGQPDEFASVITSTTDLFHPLLLQSAANVDPTPTSLAWDGSNLYVADPSNRRIVVYTPGVPNVALDGIRNSASLETFATGEVDISGTIEAGDQVIVTINGTNYTYTILSTDTTSTILTALVNLINAGSGDPNVYASVPPTLQQLLLTARVPGPPGNAITLAVSTSLNAMIAPVASNSTLEGGESAGTLAPGTLATIFGTNLSDTMASAPTSVPLPIDLAGVEVYFDGIRSPLILVSPTQINTQVPWEVSNTNSINAYVRTEHADGSVTVTTAVGVPIAPQLNGGEPGGANPGIFAQPGQDPRTALAFHSSSYATATITVSGTIAAGDVATVTVGSRSYLYTVQSVDTLTSIRDAIINVIDADPDRSVTASPGAAFTRILLQARIAGPEGDGVPISATTAGAAGGSPSLSLAVNNTNLCCSSVAGAPITPENPALPGEQFYIFGTGLGLTSDISGNLIGPADGIPYPGPALNNANASVSSLAGGKTADVISAGLLVGTVGVYEIVLQLNPDVPPSDFSELTISQNIYTSNIVTIAIGNPTQPPPVCCQ
jgi:uncharacterized protein (TIGR03437 family)